MQFEFVVIIVLAVCRVSYCRALLWPVSCLPPNTVRLPALSSKTFGESQHVHLL